MENSDIANEIPFHIVREITHRRWQIWGPRVPKSLNTDAFFRKHTWEVRDEESSLTVEDAATNNFFCIVPLLCRVFSAFYGGRGCRPVDTGPLPELDLHKMIPQALAYGILSRLRFPTTHPLLSKNIPVPPIW